MDMVHVRRKKEKEDRLSKLQDDIIHRILGFLDMKYAIQTSKLSRKWRYIWTSMPHLNFDSYTFGNLRLFAKFVKRALSHRKNGSDVSSVKLTFKGDPTPLSVKSIVNYAYSHNVQQLMIVWTTWKCPELPLHFFTCHTLKHLTIRSDEVGEAAFQFAFHVYVPKTAWDFPALETLNLNGLRFAKGEDLDKDMSLDIFSKCVNLKDLTLHCCDISSVLNFNISAPRLLNLTITGNNYYPKAINVVAPQLENFTASVTGRCDYLHLTTEGLDFLEKVNLSFSFSIESYKCSLPPLFDLFQKLRSAKFLILDGWIIQALSLFLDQVSHEPCPFNNLKCLKINMALLSSDRKEHVAKMAPQVKKYLLENSPDAVFIIDIPQVPPMKVKRPMQVKRLMLTVHNSTMSNKIVKLTFPTALIPSSDASHQISRQYVHNDVKKIANLEAKIQVQDQLIVKQKAMFEAKIHMQDKVIANHMEKIQMQDEVIAKHKAIFDEKTQMVEAAKLQHEKLMSLIIKTKIAELRAKIESENPDDEVIRSMGINIESLMDLIPESVKIKLEARFSAMYEGFKSLFFTHFDDSQWERIKSELEKEYKGFLD